MASTGELVAPLVHRPLASRVAPVLARRSVSPDAVTIAAFVVTLGAAALLAVGGWATSLAAAAVMFAGTVLDCTDGALARLTGATSAHGAWLDTMVDKVADSAVALAITWAFARSVDADWPWLLGFVAAATSLLASYERKEFALRHGRAPRLTVLDGLTRRDVRTSIIIVGAAVSQPYWALVLTGALGGAAITVAIVRVGRR